MDPGFWMDNEEEKTGTEGLTAGKTYQYNTQNKNKTLKLSQLFN